MMRPKGLIMSLAMTVLAVGSAVHPVSAESIASMDPATWPTYDILLLACGDNENSLDDEDFPAAVVAFADAGGRILLEGGDIGWNHRNDVDIASRYSLRSSSPAAAAGTRSSSARNCFSCCASSSAICVKMSFISWSPAASDPQGYRRPGIVAAGLRPPQSTFDLVLLVV